MPLLELKHVSKRYGATQVLRDINLTVNRGEFLAIVGYSGAGKTTLISLIAGLIKPDSGTVSLDGQPVAAPGPERALVFQNYSLLPWLSVYQNIHLAVEQVFPDWTRQRRHEHTEEFISLVNLAPARNKKPAELSGGMRQRVSLARALAMDPQVLLMDEPLSALDALTRATLQGEIENIWAADRKTVVMITNDVDEGILLADRIIPLSAGPAATLGPAVEVDIPRPRDRKAINHDPHFAGIRKQVIGYLTGPGRKREPVTEVTAPREMVLPDLKPIDLSAPRRFSPFRNNKPRALEVSA
jgi:nitrate/nitrite transport system ATP-binding protein